MTSTPSQCPHDDIHYDLNLNAFGNTNIRYLEITGRCKKCRADIKFQCNNVGMNPRHPTVSLGGDSIMLPLMFGAELYDGKASGYNISVKGLDDDAPRQ